MDNYNLQQTDAKIQAILNKVQPVVDNNTVAGFGNGYAICATAGATADKEVTINGFTPTIGGVFSVMFQNAFSASDPTLNVSNTGAKDLMLFGSALPAAFVPAGTILTLTYDGTNYNVIGRLNDITVKSTLESTDSPLLQDANGNFIKSTPAALASLLDVFLNGLPHGNLPEIQGDLNDYKDTGFFRSGNIVHQPFGTTYYSYIILGYWRMSVQIAISIDSSIAVRVYSSTPDTWTTWKTVTLT